jgi:hypothetical protein
MLVSYHSQVNLDIWAQCTLAYDMPLKLGAGISKSETVTDK